MATHLKTAEAAATRAEADGKVRATVEPILADIEARGDAAVRELSQQFDNWSPQSFRLSEAEIEAAIAQGRSARPRRHPLRPGAGAQLRREAAGRRCATSRSRRCRAWCSATSTSRSKSVGCYVPGGKYPLLASAHMCVLTAKVAGRQARRGLPRRRSRAAPHPAIVAAMHLAGADEIYVLGGVQAIGAMALGTDTIAPVDMLVGPGNAYVAEAKRQLFGRVGIDLFAGPTETLVIADDSVDAEICATDLLGQAEHGPTSPGDSAHQLRDAGARHAGRGRAAARASCPRPTSPGRPGAILARSSSATTTTRWWPRPTGIASEHVQVMTRDPDCFLAQHDQLRRAVPRAAHQCRLWRQGDRHQPHAADQKAARYTGGLWVGKFLKTCTYQQRPDRRG